MGNKETPGKFPGVFARRNRLFSTEFLLQMQEGVVQYSCKKSR